MGDDNLLMLKVRKIVLRTSKLLFLCCICWQIFFLQNSPGSLRQSSARLLRERPSSFKTRQFHILESEEIYSTLVDLSLLYPKFLTLTSSQALFDLPTAGGPSDCPNEKGDGCKNWIITIEDKLAHPKGSGSFRGLPEVFISGALHGDERIGPTSTVETAKLLLLAADCEAKQYFANVTLEASTCARKLEMMGIWSEERKWLARLVSTRRIVMVPATNALGYYQNERTENGLDPNRDFPFENGHSNCMLTITARTVNELFISHIFQQSLTFHAGTELILYEWGNPLYGTQPSPDDIAQSQIARAYSDYAGRFGNTPTYQYGKINDLLYAVNGGMEDWAYAASWDSSLVKPCTPSTYGGYKKTKTVYSSSVLRSFNMLVETSSEKSPNTASLGTDNSILNPESVENGHVPRNIRIALLMIETVEPYARFLSVGDVTLPHDIVPTVNSLCIPNYHFDFKRKSSISVRWTVGGAFEINKTFLVYGPERILSRLFNCSSQPTEKTLQAFLADNTDQLKFTKSQQGKTRWHAQGPTPIGSSSFSKVVFSTFLDLSKYATGEELMCVALALVDQSWSQKPANSVPASINSQSHLVKMRTDPTWQYQNAGRVVQGRLTWFSVPLTIKVI